MTQKDIYRVLRAIKGYCFLHSKSTSDVPCKSCPFYSLCTIDCDNWLEKDIKECAKVIKNWLKDN